MPFYSGPDLGGEPTADRSTSVPKGSTPSFSQDVAAYRAVRDQLLTNDIQTSPLPADTILHEVIDSNPFSASYMEYRALQEKGYGIHFALQSYGDDTSAWRGIEMRVDNADTMAVRTIMQQAESAERLPYQPVLHRMVGRVAAVHLNPEKPGYRHFRHSWSRPTATVNTTVFCSDPF